MVFQSELDFEKAVVNELKTKGWIADVIYNPTEQDLIDNWKQILYQNNRHKDRLGDSPLTDNEMAQILQKLDDLRTPFKINGFIWGEYISIRRDVEGVDLKDNPGKDISLCLCEKDNVAGGSSVYQIAEQPVFSSKSKSVSGRRGDVMLLINGMPLVHIELKNGGHSPMEAVGQIQKYLNEDVFSGIYSLVQFFVGMTPESTLYFANPGNGGSINTKFLFHWATDENILIDDWRSICGTLLCIPTAHYMTSYMVADATDMVLKVMRSYQYHALFKIVDRLVEMKTSWANAEQRGGYVWHATGSGKTLTSFKTAQVIARNGLADKIVFVVDRIELGTQSLNEYRNFVGADGDARYRASQVWATENTDDLIKKLASGSDEDKNDSGKLIVTSIQKLSRIDLKNMAKASQVRAIETKRIVFIVDECHRSTYDDMMSKIKQTFKKAVFFGFTGTPIYESEDGDDVNKDLTDIGTEGRFTRAVFGDELHRYNVRNAIADKNVLAFDIQPKYVFDRDEMREKVALHEAKADSVSEARSDSLKKAIYNKYMNMPLADVEDKLSEAEYQTDEYRNAVVCDILKYWDKHSYGGRYHAIFATSRIVEAIFYYRLFKGKQSQTGLHVTALFDPNIDNNMGVKFKQDGLEEIISDYGEKFFDGDADHFKGQMAEMKRDMLDRLAHKGSYAHLGEDVDNRRKLDILIVVDQALTGFDSKWVNTLYLDKVLRGASIIQAMSRTNRVFDDDKAFGLVRYYRRPCRMAENIENAVNVYSGQRPYDLHVPKMVDNLKEANSLFVDIKSIFEKAGCGDLVELPDDEGVQQKFAMEFAKLKEKMTAAFVQGFGWSDIDENENLTVNDENESVVVHDFKVNQMDYSSLLARYHDYKFSVSSNDGSCHLIEPGFGFDVNVVQGDILRIDKDYLDSRFKQFMRERFTDGVSEEYLAGVKDDLHRLFAVLSKEEQQFATCVLDDIWDGTLMADESKSFMDYLREYMDRAKNDQIYDFAEVFGVDLDQLREMCSRELTEATLDAYGRFSRLCDTIDFDKAKDHLLSVLKVGSIPVPKVRLRAKKYLREFVLRCGEDIDVLDKICNG